MYGRKKTQQLIIHTRLHLIHTRLHLVHFLRSTYMYKNSQFEYRQRLTLPRFVPICFLFRRMVRNGIPRVCFYFSSTERNSELFSLPLKGSEGNSESMLLFLVHGTEFRVVFSSAEGFGTEFRDFLFCGIAGIPSEIPLCSIYFVFR